jgi:lipoprotein-anchoring transpeptidase ErfK/SrfK
MNLNAPPAILDGGPRPPVSPLLPERIAFISSYDAGTIVIDTSARRLYLVQSPEDALVYPISVGREGFTWTGTETISRIASWPDWHPPAEMRVRDPRLPEKMTGGVRNPLGAKALYLGNSLYRIHGTDNERTIGRASSSGCFRMTNGHVVDLASRVTTGATVIVLDKLPRNVAGLN